MRAFLFALMVFLFLVAVKLFGDAASLLTNTYKSQWESLTNNLGMNPFVGLCLGIFLTAIMQSSSATTSIAVAMVAAGTIQLEHAVPFVMGANIGTSITSSIVSLGQIGESKTFWRAYSASALQDMFNIMTTAVLLPLEICFGYLSKLARFLVDFLPSGTGESGESWNPLPWMVDQPVDFVRWVLDSCLKTNTIIALLMMILALVILFYALVQITKNMKVLMDSRLEEMMNRVLAKNGYLGLLIGLIVTMIIQSSSITTSLLVPLVASGVLKLEMAYPILVGANIGTTITALLAAMAFPGTAGLSVALVHVLFNCSGALLWYPIPFMRLPVRGAKFLSHVSTISRKYVFMWLGCVFFIIPLIGLWLFS